MPHERTTRTGGTGRNGHRTVTFHDVPDAPAAASRTRAQASAHAQSDAVMGLGANRHRWSLWR